MISPSLKNGWRRVKFGDVVANANDYFDRESKGVRTYVAGPTIHEQRLRITEPSTAEVDEIPPTFKRTFQSGDVLFHSRNIAKLAVPDFGGITGEKLFVLRSKDVRVLSQDFLPFLMSTGHFDEYVSSNLAGSVNKFLNWRALANYQFPLPPIEEQKRIAEILWAADEAVEEYLRAEERLSSLKSRYFREFLEVSAMRTVPCSDLFRLPPRNGHSPKTNASGRGAPTLSIGAVRNGIVNPDGSTKYAEISSTDLDKYRLEAGDILVVRGNGNRNLCGKAGVVADVPEDCFYPDLLIRIKFDESKILPAFAVEQWNEPATHQRLLAYAKSTNGIWKVNGKDLRRHKLDVPSLDAQVHIVQRLDDFKKKQYEISRHADTTRGLKSRLLNSLTQSGAHV